MEQSDRMLATRHSWRVVSHPLQTDEQIVCCASNRQAAEDVASVLEACGVSALVVPPGGLHIALSDVQQAAVARLGSALDAVARCLPLLLALDEVFDRESWVMDVEHAKRTLLRVRTALED